MSFDAIAALLHYNAGRDPELLARKYAAMRKNSFAFLRASCHLFYQRLPADKLFTTAPRAWSCGDLHLENFGSYKGDNRSVYFDINDFDEAALAPVSWDLVRMLSSIAIAARNRSPAMTDSEELQTQFLQSYCKALALGKPFWIDRDAKTQGPVHDLLHKLNERKRSDFLNSRTSLDGKKRQLLLDGKRALPATASQKETATQLLQTFAKQQSKPDFYEVLDVARRIAGVGSLGLSRYVILVQGRGSPDENYLLDLKQAQPSTLAQLCTPQTPWPNEATRIVQLQQRLQAMPMAFLHPLVGDKNSFVLRGLQPNEDRIEVTSPDLHKKDLLQLMDTLGQITAWAHLRGANHQGAAPVEEFIEFAQTPSWQPALMAHTQAAVQQVLQDSQAFDAAYDDGVFPRTKVKDKSTDKDKAE